MMKSCLLVITFLVVCCVNVAMAVDLETELG
jgi:hypothetical protein